MRSKRIIYFQWLVFHKATQGKTQDVEVLSGRVAADLYSHKEIGLRLAHKQESTGWPTLRSSKELQPAALRQLFQNLSKVVLCGRQTWTTIFWQILFKYFPILSHTFLPEVFLQAVLVHDCSHFHEAVLNEPSDMPFTPPALWCPIKGGAAGRKAAMSSCGLTTMPWHGEETAPHIP